MKTKTKILLALTIFLGFSLRIFNINWDNGYIFHPDERAIIMTVDKLIYPTSAEGFLSPQSSFNPNFFAYGNFPIYLLKITSDVAANINPVFSQYNGMQIVGRVINTLFDTATILIIFLLSRKIFNVKTGLLASFFYSIAVFPIQNSHFFTVDIPLTFFTLLTLYFLYRYIKISSIKNTVFIGISFGLALATKISILPLIFIVTFGFLIAHLKRKKSLSPRFYLTTAFYSLIFLLTSVVIFFATQPYVFLDFDNFFKQASLQSKMAFDPFIFPYTLQYVGKIPVIHEASNIILWGLGIPISLLAFSGILYLTFKTLKKYKKYYQILPLILFFWLYFLLVSNYAVGWMRYMLPIYPILSIFAAVFSVNILFPLVSKQLRLKRNIILKRILLIIFLTLSFVWTLSFMPIYTKPNTRVEASNWINKNIPRGSTITTEHWDDGLPIYGGQNYNIISLPLYDPDTKLKWENINSDLEKADYIIIASNRLYTPLQKLTDCEKLYPHPCYTQTSEYYKKLFNGTLGFKKVAEFTSYPTIPFLNIEINDQSADESFTVYDHPNVIIYEKNK